MPDADRKIAALRLVQRIKQHEIDGHGAQLASIRAHQARLRDESENLLQRRDSEGHITGPESAPYLAGFLRAIEARRAFLESEIQELDLKAADIEARLQTAYRELKTNEAVLLRVEEEQRLERERKEIATAEEFARNVYLRRRG